MIFPLSCEFHYKLRLANASICQLHSKDEMACSNLCYRVSRYKHSIQEALILNSVHAVSSLTRRSGVDFKKVSKGEVIVYQQWFQSYQLSSCTHR